MTDAPLPVALIVGFLGSGKTTLVNHLLRAAPERRIGVLVNDFGETAIDADLVVSQAEGVIGLANGCICCSLRGELGRTLMGLAEASDRPEHLLLEASGVSEPRPMLEVLLELERMQVIRLDAVIAVEPVVSEAADANSAALAERQRQAADFLILTKADLASPTLAAARTRELTESGRRVLVASQDNLPPDVLLGLEGSPERWAERDLSVRLEGLPAGGPDVAHGYRTWRFVTEVPVPIRPLVACLRALPPAVLRAKGFLHLLERPGDRLLLHLTGSRVQLRTVGSWGETPPRSELVFIGRDSEVNPDALAAELETALRGVAGAPPPDVLTWRRDFDEP